ncbi:hypothetical protein Glove_194g143 [Diversispora epigaea]|uniref:Uncharacterized protein n=1 Tax=Diversispora epigaea TaxID=1348612 RepID=A0A397ILD9_9GLOM|nr:hypothetical protein Glove_194g143 [Diversispora epigaea]
MKLIGEKKIFSISKLWKRSSPAVHSEDSQAQQPVLLEATSNPTSPSPPKNSLLRHLNITKFKIDCAKHFKKENQVVHYCTKYLVNFPNSYNTMCNRAEAYGKLKKYDEAIDDLDAAILLRPQRSTAWCLRGVVKGLKKSYTDALDDLNKAIVIDPIDCLALKWRAFCYYNLKSYEEALSDLNIVINLDAASGSTIKLASITDATPKIELSSFGNLEVDNNINALSLVHYCTKYLVNFPNSYNTMCNRAEAYGKLKKYDEAIDDLDAAILLRPQRSTAWCLRGVVKGLKKSYTDALDDLNKAIVIDPIDCLALKWRAFCYYNLKSYEEALSDLNIVINLDAASGSTIKLASITDATPKIELSSFGNLEVDNNINALSCINDMRDKNIINNITSTQEEPSTFTKQASITGTTSKARLSGFDDLEVDININSLSNVNNLKEKNIINENNPIQKEPFINSASIDTTYKTALSSLSNLEVDSNINVLSNINNTEKKNDINNINSASNETASITDTTFKSGVSEVDSKINALSNIINNFKSTQKELSCEDESKNEINEIFDEIFNCVEKMKKHREQQQKKRNNVNESNYYYSGGWKSEKKYH